MSSHEFLLGVVLVLIAVAVALVALFTMNELLLNAYQHGAFRG